MESKTTLNIVEQCYEKDIIDVLKEYIKIPNVSPSYDPNWDTNGYQEQATELFVDWAQKQDIKGMTVKHLTHDGRTPLIFISIDAQEGFEDKNTVLLYGHLDKQPPMTGWRENLDPYVPVLEGEKLYGRGGADDGYALFASLTSIKALQDQGRGHGKIVVIIEASEESGSPDLPFWVDQVSNEIGNVGLVVCLDSGCGNYEQFWLTTSLRGVLMFTLRVNILTEGVHSGAASGIVPSSFRIVRQLLDRIEDSGSGKIKIKELYGEIPAHRVAELTEVSHVLGSAIYEDFPFIKDAKPAQSDLVDLILAGTWEPTISYTGIDGIPSVKEGGNVLRPETTVKLSFRLPPTVNPDDVIPIIKRVLEENPPYGATVEATPLGGAQGWNSPALAPWLSEIVQETSETFFGKPAMLFGEGGTIPFMNMLGEKFPESQFVITGVLGPQSNAHGPNEFLHLGMAKKLTACVSHIVDSFFQH